MLLSVLDILECPICQEASRKWYLDGDYTETDNDKRFTNGSVKCPNEHKWTVVEEVLRFDKENSQERMEFLDHPRTGFPSEVGEQERFTFLDSLEELVEEINTSKDEIYFIQGDPILFMKYFPKSAGKFVLSHPDEGTLRQLQEISVRKRMYDQMSFIRKEEVEYLGNYPRISVFQDKPRNGINIMLTKEDYGEVKWEGKRVDLRYLESK